MVPRFDLVVDVAQDRGLVREVGAFGIDARERRAALREQPNRGVGERPVPPAIVLLPTCVALRFPLLVESI